MFIKEIKNGKIAKLCIEQAGLPEQYLGRILLLFIVKATIKHKSKKIVENIVKTSTIFEKEYFCFLMLIIDKMKTANVQ